MRGPGRGVQRCRDAAAAALVWRQRRRRALCRRCRPCPCTPTGTPWTALPSAAHLLQGGHATQEDRPAHKQQAQAGEGQASVCNASCCAHGCRFTGQALLENAEAGPRGGPITHFPPARPASCRPRTGFASAATPPPTDRQLSRQRRQTEAAPAGWQAPKWASCGPCGSSSSSAGCWCSGECQDEVAGQGRAVPTVGAAPGAAPGGACRLRGPRVSRTTQAAPSAVFDPCSGLSALQAVSAGWRLASTPRLLSCLLAFLPWRAASALLLPTCLRRQTCACAPLHPFEPAT